MNRYFFYTTCLFLSIACFYFSIAEGLFAWFHADELGALSVYNGYGLLGCTEHYYLNTTINRISAALGVCGMAGTTKLFTPFLGWVLVRLVFYALVPVSMAFLLKEITRISFAYSLVIAFFISAIALFVMSDSIYYMFGLDLAIYGAATFTFFILIALFPKSTQSALYFAWFCLVYAFNLNSHEVFLPISGFFIPLFMWHRHMLIHRTDCRIPLDILVKDALKDWRIWVLSAIYIGSALTTSHAPGMEMRQNLWPSTGTFSDGLLYMLLSVEEAAYFIARSYVLVIVLFLLGALFRLSAKNPPLKTSFLCCFLFCAPLAYLLITGFLIGITPSLWIGSLRTEPFQWIEAWSEKKDLFLHGGFAIRQNLFLYTGLFLDGFLAGFFIAGRVSESKQALIKRSWPFKPTLAIVVAIIFLFHPDGVGGFRILSTLFKSDPIENYKPQKREQTSSGSVAQMISHSFIPKALGEVIFVRKRPGNHESAMVNIMADNYFLANRGKLVSADSMELVYSLAIPDYRVTKEFPWIAQIYSAYEVIVKEECVQFLDEPESELTCYNVSGQNKLTALLKEKKVTPPGAIHFTFIQETKAKNENSNCLSWVDKPGEGEHFVAANDLSLSKGFHYFVLETLPTKTELYIYITGDKIGVIFPWLNQPNGSGGWRNHSTSASLEPVFSQAETSSQSEKLKIVVYSAVDQKIQLRWQHGYAGSTSYKGRSENISSICSAQFGHIVDTQ